MVKRETSCDIHLCRGLKSQDLEREICTSTGRDSRPDGVKRRQRVLVRNGSESASGSIVDGATEIVASGNSVAVIRRKQGLLGRDKHIVLNQKLSTFSGIDSIPDVVIVVVINAEIISTRSRNGWVTLTGQFQSETKGYGSWRWRSSCCGMSRSGPCPLRRCHLSGRRGRLSSAIGL